jgi:hypothetical protein
VTAALSLLSFTLPALTGILIIHALWAEKNNLFDLILKLSLGIGIGLGISSLLYFVYLLLFAGSRWFLFLEIFVFAAVFVFLSLRGRWSSSVLRVPRPGPTKQSLMPHMTTAQIWMLILAGVVFLSAAFGILNYSRQRILGDWDAWMIYNRAARFLYRDQAAWRESFPQEMSVIFHADYPLLLASNTAARWDTLGKETPYVPMFQSVLFAFAALGLNFGALGRFRSTGQASLGLILLAGVPFYLLEGGRQTADLPLAFFFLAAVVFIFSYYEEKRFSLLFFAGFTAALAAWTKNEGLLFFLIASAVVVIDELRLRSFRGILYFAAGSAIPLCVSLYFKLALAPASEFLSGGVTVILQDITDPARHGIILAYFKNIFLFSNGWYRVGILPILCVYFLVFHSCAKENPQAVFIGLAIFALQIIGYYAFYLISPYELDWHLSSSIDRLFIHVYPTILFVTLAASQTPETIFAE